jgi:ribonuclease BN (tRNA processing enzyme)
VSGRASTRTRRGIIGSAAAGAAALGLAGLGTACSGSQAATEDGDRSRGGDDPTREPPPRPDATDEPATQGTTKIVVLGSHGGQQITQLTGANSRAGSSVLIDVDGELTILDCGAGSVHRLAEAGYDANQVRNVLVPHCHADHVAELASLAGFAWSSGRNGGDPDRRLDVYGPTGIRDYELGMKRAFRRTIADQEGPLAQRPTFDDFAFWHELGEPDEAATVFRNQHVDVRAIRVQHGDLPAVGYRVTTRDLDIAFSGDRGTRGDDFADFARGADVLFHEVIHRPLVESALRQRDTAPSFVDHLVNDHTDAPDAGRLATEAGVPTLVLYHLIPGSPAVTDDAWTELVRPHFAGRIVVARDLDEI